MRIKRKNLNRLIERFLLESEKTDPRGNVNLEKISDDYVAFDEIIDVMSICLTAIESEKSGKRLKIKYY